ncbi:TadE/TadG family type IV pilus assembly protein [Paenibacillus tuaregi]|uniref:TadE/TadG family type IV pilus assembly protein n=1 Tax=Paenibacillus tuaregi TaxID=1816681 RepID=UPI0008393070|nr:TadE/TadG family type IV pilus assembly protein [Paenibacillus tuaregi]
MTRAFTRDNRGSFTLESSLVMPVVLMSTMLLLFFCLYLYQTSILQMTSAAAAERAAYTWDNSFKNSRSGAVETGKSDPLYWRLKDDVMLQTLFGWAGAEETASIQLPSGDSGDSLPAVKLSRIGQEIPDAIHGTMAYNRNLLFRKVTVSVDRLVRLKPLERAMGRDLMQLGQSSSYVVEPTEWIRTVDLGRYYAARFKSGTGSGASPKEAGAALKQYGK